jgi:hypothetical protein
LKIDQLELRGLCIIAPVKHSERSMLLLAKDPQLTPVSIFRRSGNSSCAELEGPFQRDFISKQILIMLDQVRREQDPEELSLLLGKIACFENELEVLRKKWREALDSDSYVLPSDATQNTLGEEQFGSYSERANVEKYLDYVSLCTSYAWTLDGIKVRTQAPDPVRVGPHRKKSPPEAATPQSVKKRSVRPTPMVTKKASPKSRDKHGSISVVVKY